MTRPLAVLAAAAIAVATLAVYAQVRDFVFLGFDDPRYLYQNEAVMAGLTADGVVWAFTTNHKSRSSCKRCESVNSASQRFLMRCTALRD